MASYLPHREDLLKRLRRIEGQTRGLQRMLEDEKYCVDVLTQISSVIAATRKVGGIILEDHISGCVTAKLTEGQSGEGTAGDRDETLAELLQVIERFSKS